MSNLDAKVAEIKKLVLQASFDAGACHIGSALSCVPFLVETFYTKIPDYFIFAKASGVASYYAILADLGLFPKERIAYFLKHWPLPSKEVPGVLHTVGSLGHGLPVAVGLALGQPNKKVVVLMSDGEVQEGTTWESALFARQHNLKNLHVYVDDNKIQGLGFVKDILDLRTAYDFLSKTLPNFTVLDTVKGQGVSFMENDPAWHYKNLDEELLQKALAEI